MSSKTTGHKTEHRAVSAIRRLAMVAALALAACATQPPPASPLPEALLQDHLFGAPTAPVDAGQVFALSDSMRRYLSREIFSLMKSQGPQGAIAVAVHSKAQLRLEYDASYTRNASEAFEARTGNCLSLVLMTAAFAKELGLEVRYQTAIFEETWSRSGTLLLRSGHVNISIGPKLQDRAKMMARTFTIDFLPEHEIRGLRTREISEATLVAMYMNNRAVEALVRGRLDDAYAWASAAVRYNPDYLGAHNTLGTIYARHGNIAEAEHVYLYVVQADPTHTRSMSNLADLYERQGRTADAAFWQAKLAQLEPEPPYYYFNRGIAALKASDYSTARDMFARETSRSRDSSESHYWLGVAYYQLGDIARAAKHLGIALDYSTSRGDRELYSAKLEALRKSAQH
jgi:tetratricopeptide (TPR) repeat protein